MPRVKAGSAHEHSNSRRRQPTSQRSQRSTYPELPHSPAGAIAPRTNRGELVRRAGATPRAPACGGIINDRVGNLLELFHSAGGGANTWTRTYSYTTGTNRLANNTIPGGSATYTHDAHGSITSMPHLASITYGPFDQMANADLGGGGDAYYQYDASGQRVRKLIDTGANLIKERIYLGAYEIYREHISGDIDLERQSLHVMDGTRRVALLETLTIEDGDPVTTPVTHQRFQLGNHLDSALLEVDEAGMVVSYEELLPYGASAYRSARSDVDVSPRRYRYTGKERDDETGLYYYGARYYAAWLGRWTSADPLGIGADGPGLYNYTRGSPVVLVDPTGGEPMPPPAAGVSPPPPPPPPGKPPSFGQRVSAATRSIARDLRQASSASAGGSPPPTASATASSGGETSVLGNVLSGAAEEVGHKASSLAKGVIDHPLQALQSATPLGAGAALVIGAVSSSTRIIETAMASATVASGDESQRQFGKLLVNLVELALTVAPFVKGGKTGKGSSSDPLGIADDVKIDFGSDPDFVMPGTRQGLLSGSVSSDASIGSSVGALRRLEFEASPKHPVGRSPRPGVSPGPADGQAALDVSVEVGKRRVGIDYGTEEFVVFDETHPGRTGISSEQRVFHGHTRNWNELDSKMQNALIDAEMANRKGKVQRGSR